MNGIILKSNHLVSSIETKYVRSIYPHFDLNQRMIGIFGPRAVGKTTMLLQMIKQQYGISSNAVFLDLDSLYFSNHSLQEFAAYFHSLGGQHLFVDNVNKYAQWSNALKEVYLKFPELKITFAGSSSEDLVKHFPNLTGIADTYSLGYLSFREYLSIHGILNLSTISLEELISQSQNLVQEMEGKSQITSHFEKFLMQGGLPLFDSDHLTIRNATETQAINSIEQDMVNLEGYDAKNGLKVKRLMQLILEQAPFKPNILRLSKQIGLHRNTLASYLFHLQKAGLITLIYPAESSISILQKPEMVYVTNTGLYNLLGPDKVIKESLIETFAVNMLTINHEVRLTDNGFFEVDEQWQIGIEGYKKIAKRHREKPNTLIFTTDTHPVKENSMPVWLLGLLY